MGQWLCTILNMLSGGKWFNALNFCAYNYVMSMGVSETVYAHVCIYNYVCAYIYTTLSPHIKGNYRDIFQIYPGNRYIS